MGGRMVKEQINNQQMKKIIEQAARQVGKPVVYSTLIIIVSFLPVFLLTGQEGKLFHPLAWTKTIVMLISAVLAITLVPALMSYFMNGKMRPEHQNPVTSFFNRLYEPLLKMCLHNKWTVLGLNILGLFVAIPLILNTGREFMPPLNEGSLLFMPVALPDVSNTEIKRILQIQNKIIMTMPEVKQVLGKAGRANTATDNAPTSMIESIILLKPQSEWRKGLTKDSIVKELDKKLKIPGITNGWTQPIINRINMLSTGIRTDVGVKVYGQNLDTIYNISRQIEKSLVGTAGIVDLYPEQITGGKFLNIEVKKEALGRYGLTADDVNAITEIALGGLKLGSTIEGRRRFGISVRLAQDYRANLTDIKRALVQTPNGPVPLSAVANISVKDGAAMINSENALLRGTVLFNIRGRDLGNTVDDAIENLKTNLVLPKGYFIEWSGQYENQLRAGRTLLYVIPAVFLIIFIILYFTYNQLKEAIITMLSVPFALIGGVFLVYFWGINLSVAVAVGFIALFGVAVETGMLMIVYLDEALAKKVKQRGEDFNVDDLRAAVITGSAKRLRPKLMTVSVTLIGLLPVLWTSGTGNDLMLPIALPMIGGMITSSIHVLLVTPIIFQMVKERELRKNGEVLILNKEEKS